MKVLGRALEKKNIAEGIGPNETPNRYWRVMPNQVLHYVGAAGSRASIKDGKDDKNIMIQRFEA